MESDAVSLNFFFGLICWFQLANNFSVPFNFSLYTEKRNLPIAACDSLLVPNYLACSTDFDLPFLLIYLSICLSTHLSIYPSIVISIYLLSQAASSKRRFLQSMLLLSCLLDAVQFRKCSACSSRGARANSDSSLNSSHCLPGTPTVAHTVKGRGGLLCGLCGWLFWLTGNWFWSHSTFDILDYGLQCSQSNPHLTTCRKSTKIP